MAATAVEAELAIVYVVRPMTIYAATAESRVPRHWSPVASLALDVAMGAVENKAGLFVVIE